MSAVRCLAPVPKVVRRWRDSRNTLAMIGMLKHSEHHHSRVSSLYAMPCPLGLSVGSGDRVVRRRHDGLAPLASVAPVRRTNVIATHHCPLARQSRAQSSHLAAAAMKPWLEAVAALSTWMMRLEIERPLHRWCSAGSAVWT